MKSALIILVSPLLFSMPLLAEGSESASVRAISAIGQKEIDEGRSVGLVIGVARGSEILHLEGYGQSDLELSVPATPESVFRIGSITKMFTAAAILLLREEGKLALDDPLSKHLPEYPEEVARKVTLQHLLNHTSGILSFTDLPDHRLRMRNDVKHEQILERFQDKPLRFEPGEKFQYCNSGYYLLGMVIESVSGKTYEEFLQARLLDPLQLEATVYDRHSRIIPNRSRGYSIWGDQPVNAPFVSMSQPFAAGALASTAGDLIQWSRALDEGSILKAESRELMFAPGSLNNGKKIRYGLGCFVEKLDGHRAVRHGGGIPGFVTELIFFPDSDITVVVLTNANLSSPRKMADQIARLVLPEKE